MKIECVQISISPLSNYKGWINKEGIGLKFPVESLSKIGITKRNIERITNEWDTDIIRQTESCFSYAIQISTSETFSATELAYANKVMKEIINCNWFINGSCI